MTIATTLNRIRACSPCKPGWETLLSGLGKTKADDEPLPFSRILEINGLDDALWCLRADPQHGREWRLLAVALARRVQHLMTDPRSIAAMDVAERYANGHATDEELAAAGAAARAAAEAAAQAAAQAAAWAAAADAAWAAAWAAAYAAAEAAAGDAAYAAAGAARAAAEDAAEAAAEAAARAARDAARAAERAAQSAEFLRIVGEG